jgi:hypothetical protein
MVLRRLILRIASPLRVTLGLLLSGLQGIACSGSAGDVLKDDSGDSGMSADSRVAQTEGDATVESGGEAGPGDGGGSEAAAVDAAPVDSGGVDTGSDAREAGCSVNACGGCTTLGHAVGSACGCGGKYACNGTEAVTCQGASSMNACGGCSTLSDPPGGSCGPCGDGQWACNGTEAVACQGASPMNACGGCSTLSNPPGGSCGTCGDGQWACNGTDSTTCNGASSRNVCGSCGDLDYTLHQSCTPPAPNGGCCGTWECAADKNDDWCKPNCNACGGCGGISGGTAGTSCGSCGGVWTCSDGNTTVCKECAGNACCNNACCAAGYSCVGTGNAGACVETCSDGVTACVSPQKCTCASTDGGISLCSCH